MNDALKTLLENIDKAPKGDPSFKKVANLLDEINPTTSDWKTIAPVLKTHYSFKDNNDLVAALKIGSGEDQYIDDFDMILKQQKIGGWIGEYVSHTRGIEPPTAFHFATALTVLGAALQRQVHIPRGYFKIWPAVHSLLSGPSATMKTTAAEYGNRMLMESGRTFGVLGESKQYIHNKLHNIQKSHRDGHAVGMLYSPEIADFLGDDEWKKSLTSYLIRLFDSENSIESGTLSRDEQTIENVSVTFLGCSNEELLDQAVPKIALGSGFMSRLLIWHCEGTDRVHDNPRVPEEAANWEWLKERLMLTQFIRGEVHLDKEAEEWYKFWYTVKWRTHFPKDDRLVPFHKRIRNYILLIGMLLSISDEIGGEETTPIIGEIRYIKEQHLVQAEALLNWIYTKIPRLYDLLGNSAYGKEQIRIINILKRHKRAMDVKELSKKLKFPHKKLREHIDTLKKDGRIGEDKGLVFMKKDLRKEEKKK